MKKFLLLRLAGNMFFGGTKIDEHSKTQRIPPKSFVVGLLGNAMGYDRKADKCKLQALQDRLSYAIRIDKAGTFTNDFQTVDMDFVAKTAGIKIKNTKRIIKHNSFLSDGLYLLAISLDESNTPNDVSLDDLFHAIENQARTLFLGHKNCVPSLRLGLGVFDGDSFDDILARVPKLKNWTPSRFQQNNQKDVSNMGLEAWLPIESELDFESPNAFDQILSFSDDYDHDNKCYGGMRFMKRKFIELSNNQIDLGGRNFEYKNQEKIDDSNSISSIDSIVGMDNVVNLDPIDFVKDANSIDSEESNDLVNDTKQQEGLHEINLVVDKDKMLILAKKHRLYNTTLEMTNDSYASHILIACLFGHNAPKTFNVSSISEDLLEIKIYSMKSLDALKKIAYEKNEKDGVNKHSLTSVLWEKSKEKVVGVLEKGQKLEMTLTTNPIRRNDNKEVDAYVCFQNYIEMLKTNNAKSKDELEKLMSLTKEEIYQRWLMEKLVKFPSIKVENINVACIDVEKVSRKNAFKKNKVFEQPLVSFVLEIEILEPIEINSLQVGRQKSFGMGMMKISKNL